MTDAAREMTLREWVERLPGDHKARREYIALVDADARCTALEAELREARGEVARLQEQLEILDRDCMDCVHNDELDTTETCEKCDAETMPMYTPTAGTEG